MQYIQNTLLAHEAITYWTRPHWIIFVASGFWVLLAIIFHYFGADFGLTLSLFGRPIYSVIAILLFFVGLFYLLSAFITYQTSEYGVTNKRVLMKTGLIRRNSLEIFLDKVEAVRVNQSILGRIIGYGSIAIIGTGGTTDIFFSIPQPLDFRKKVQQQIDLMENKES